MLSAVIGLVGVLVGGVVGGIVASEFQYLFLIRREHASALVAARLIAVELDVLSASHDGFSPQSSPPETPIWKEHQAAMALVLPPDHWRTVADAYAQLSRVSTPVNAMASSSGFVDAATRAIRVLVSDAEGPLRRRGSWIERRDVRWPNVA